jgi:Holliday junction resolvasome RuvABC endonuclease subunit
MNEIDPNHFRILAIAPSTRGFGFAVLEGQDTLVDWGVKTVIKEGKNIQSLKKVKELIAHYQPGVLVLEDALAKSSLRSPRIRRLCRQISTLAATHKVSVTLFSRDQVMRTFFSDGQGTKYALAQIVAKRFPDELSQKLPPERKLGNSEDSRMNIFDAVVLAVVFRLKQAESM